MPSQDWPEDWSRKDFPTLLERWVCRQDQEAYDEIGRWLRDHAPGFIRNRLPGYNLSSEDVEDLASQAMMACLKSLEDVWEQHGEEADAKALLSMKAKGVVSNFIKRLKNNPPPDSLTPYEEGQERDLPGGINPERLFENEDFRMLFWRCLRDCLDETTAQLLRLHYVDGVDEQTAADLLCISYENARQRISDARRNQAFRECVKSLLEHYLEGENDGTN